MEEIRISLRTDPRYLAGMVMPNPYQKHKSERSSIFHIKWIPLQSRNLSINTQIK